MGHKKQTATQYLIALAVMTVLFAVKAPCQAANCNIGLQFPANPDGSWNCSNTVILTDPYSDWEHVTTYYTDANGNWTLGNSIQVPFLRGTNTRFFALSTKTSGVQLKVYDSGQTPYAGGWGSFTNTIQLP